MRFEEIKTRLKKQHISFAYSYHYNLAPYLYPEEEAFIKQAIPNRQEEFAKGRQCARTAIDSILGYSSFPILQGAFGEPLFDQEIVGTISHTDRFYIAAVAFNFKMLSLGVDIEENVNRDIGWDLIAEKWELSQCQSYNIPTITLFSLKEALIKCFSPLLQKRLFYNSFNIRFMSRTRIDDFNEVRFEIQEDISIHEDQMVCGYYISENNHIVSVAYINK